MSAESVVSPEVDESLDLWIDPETGAIVPADTDGATRIERWDVEIPAGAEDLAAKEDYSWLPSWFLKRHGHVAAERATLMSQYKRKMAVLDAIEKYMIWRWHGTLSGVVEADIEKQKGKKKSFDYLEGRAGFRTGRKCEVVDEEQAMEWARGNCPEAIKVSEFLRVSYLPKSKTATHPGAKQVFVDVPGVRRWEEEVFFAKGNVAKPGEGDE